MITEKLMPTIPACPVKKMEVGVNYPWMWDGYGWYFGGGQPPGNDLNWGTWPDLLEKNLIYLKKELGIKVVRLFLMCNCFNYGEFETVTVNDKTEERFKPPSTLPPEFGQHLEEILKRFQRQEMEIIPVLIDFQALQERGESGRYGARGRSSIVTDSGIRKKFFDDVLRKFLDISLPYYRSIYAWEVINEPIWTWYTGINGKGWRAILTEAQVRDFLKSAIHIIETKSTIDPVSGLETGIQAFKATVGHRFSDDMMHPQQDCGMKPQFHYYGYGIPGSTIVGAGIDYSPVIEHSQFYYSTFLGEFGSREPNPIYNLKGPGHGMAWAELNGKDTGTTSVRVFERLKALHSHGYDLALVWPDLADLAKQNSIDSTGKLYDQLKLSLDAQQGIKDYQRWCPP